MIASRSANSQGFVMMYMAVSAARNRRLSVKMAGLPDPKGRGALARGRANSRSVHSPRLNKRLTPKHALT